jgi:hypothetical protein
MTFWEGKNLANLGCYGPILPWYKAMYFPYMFTLILNLPTRFYIQLCTTKIAQASFEEPVTQEFYSSISHYIWYTIQVVSLKSKLLVVFGLKWISCLPCGLRALAEFHLIVLQEVTTVMESLPIQPHFFVHILPNEVIHLANSASECCNREQQFQVGLCMYHHGTDDETSTDNLSRWAPV